MAKPFLGYWEIRGLAQSIRFLLEYLGVDYEERRYKMFMDEGDNLNREDWLNEKFNLGLSFPNIPYWIDNERGIKLTESRAILRHIARTYGPNLLGITSQEQMDADMLENFGFDCWYKLVTMCFYGFEKDVEAFKKELPQRLEKISNFLADKKWFTGGNINVVDFWLYEMLYQHALYDEKILSQFPNLEKYVKNFENLPAIQNYIKSVKYIKGPCYSLNAKQNLG